MRLLRLLRSSSVPEGPGQQTEWKLPFCPLMEHLEDIEDVEGEE